MVPTKLIQSRIYRGSEPLERGNCWPTVIACMMGYDDPEKVLQFQELYHTSHWSEDMLNWLDEHGCDMTLRNGHRQDDKFYFVVGDSPRMNGTHICIYQNGKLWHDPHPDGTGILNELTYWDFEIVDAGKL